MTIEGKPLNHVTEVDLQYLVQNRVREDKTIEFKRDLPGQSPKDSRGFLAQVSSFANTHGGDLLFGVHAEEGIARDVCGVEESQIDSFLLRAEALMRDSLEPRLTGVQSRAIRLTSGKVVLAFRIGRSWALPHRVKLEGHDKFYGRNAAGKYQLDVSELRTLFNLSETLAERVRGFRAERLSKILSGDAPILIKPGPKTILHMVPLGAFGPASSSVQVDFRGLNHKCPPIGRTDSTHRINFDGLLIFTNEYDTEATRSYVQVFRNGCVEALDAGMIQIYKEYQNRGVIPSAYFERVLIQAVGNYVEAMKHVRAQPPFVIMLSLLGVKGYEMPDSRGFFNGHPIDRDNLVVPEVLVESFEFDPGKIMRPVFDPIWNAAGRPKSPNFDEEGGWKEPR